IASAGHRVIAHPWVYRLNADVAVMVSGNAMAHVYVNLEHRERPFWEGMSESGRELAEQLVLRASVDLLLMPMDAERCAVWSAKRGRATITRAGDRFSYRTTDGDPLGIGRELHDVTSAYAHEATVQTDYPDSVVQIARLAGADRVGDMILSA